MGELRLVLASGSPRRRELLGLLGLPYDVALPEVVEDRDPRDTPVELVSRLSRLKARQIAIQCARPGSDGRAPVVVACDTIVVLDGRVLGKPADTREAEEMLRLLRSRPHTVYTAFTLADPADGASFTDVAETTVMMRGYTDKEIAAYVASGDPLDKAGAYAIQHPQFSPVAHWEGCYANVVGLPLCHVASSLAAWDRGPAEGVPEACQAHFGQRCDVYPSVLAEQPGARRG
jgi:septum formation protein